VVGWLTDHVSGTPLSYLVVLLAAGGDVLFPLIPSETVVITGGVVAAQGGLHLWLLVPAAVLGAMLGDLASFGLGRLVGERVAHRIFRGPQGAARLARFERALRRRGGVVIIVGRFIPGGRTASTFAAGTLEMPLRRFLLADLVAAACWSLYVALLGYLGGTAFQHSAWKPVLGAMGLAAVAAGGVEAWRRHGVRRGRDPLLGERV
jgi:membrane protein DedA with SNARE-associated domain